MSNKLFDKLSGANVTIIACAAILAPSALYGAVTYSKVQIIGENGQTPAVQNSSLSTADYYARYRSDPRNYRVIRVSNFGNKCETAYAWPVPSGSAFIITSIGGYEAIADSTLLYSSIIVYDGANCSGHELTRHAGPKTDTVTSIAVDANIPVAAGSTVSVYSANNNGFTFIYGFLVPASFVASNQLSAAAVHSSEKGKTSSFGR